MSLLRTLGNVNQDVDIFWGDANTLTYLTPISKDIASILLNQRFLELQHREHYDNKKAVVREC